MKKGALMELKWFYAGCVLAGFFPFLILIAIVAHFCLGRLGRSRCEEPKRRCSRLCTFGLALGMAFVQLMCEFYQPDMVYVLSTAQQEVADEDESSDPDTPESRLRYFHRQLRRIRRGEPVERLVLRI
ncbi:MAG TPA: hypothetical protein VI320_18670 [Terracidiphilus sp.]